MANISIQINRASIEKKFKKALEFSGDAKRVSYNRAYSIYRKNLYKMIQEFDAHPVSVELSAGSTAPVTTPNISDTLDGYGNLFSFIGFEKGSNPVQDLKDLLIKGTMFRRTVFRDGVWYFKVSTPTWAAIEKATPMPWEGGSSWVRGIEGGISNLSHYLNKKVNSPDPSSSGGGIQSPWEVNDDLVFKKTRYISEILENFRANFNK